MDKKSSKTKKVDKTAEKMLELEENWKRALADYKNLEKRVAEEKKALVNFSNILLIESLLPILDNFEQLENHADDMGIKMSIKEFRNALKQAGLSEVEVSLEDEFDSEKMDAIESVDGNKNEVVQIIRRGYFFKDKLLRPVSVKVGNGENAKPEKGDK